VLGRYRVSASGDVSTSRFGGYRRTVTALEWAGLRPVPPAALKTP
jgi:hypothetical protein